MNARRLYEHARRYQEHGTLPAAGGFDDQDPLFCDALRIVTDVYSTITGRGNG